MLDVQATVDLGRCGALRYAWRAVEAQLDSNVARMRLPYREVVRYSQQHSDPLLSLITYSLTINPGVGQQRSTSSLHIEGSEWDVTER